MNILMGRIPRGGCILDGEAKILQERHAFGTNYVVIHNPDKRCLVRALVVAKAHADLQAGRLTRQSWRTIKKGGRQQTHLTGELQLAAGMPTAGPFSVEDLPRLLAALGADFGVRVFSASQGNTIVYQRSGQTMLNLHWVGDSHFNAILKVPAFFGAKRFCEQCQQPHDANANKHSCAEPCPTCKAPGANCRNAPRDYKKCDKCGLSCYNQACFGLHLKLNKAGRSRCSSVKVCSQCNFLEELGVGKKPEHICGFSKCPLCKQYDDTATHACFVQAPKIKDAQTPIVYYDCETYLEDQSQHRVHLLTAATSCNACADKPFPRPKCYKCGGLHDPECCLSGSKLDADFSRCIRHGDCACGMQVFVAVGPNPLALFLSWLTRTFKTGCLVLAHNGAGYDHFLLLGSLLTGLAKKKPTTIFQDSRLMYMKVDKMTFKDSLNFIPIGLDQFPKALGLDLELAKGFFPHQFNQPANWGYVGDFPDIESYGGMANKNYEAIKAWLDSQTGQFSFNQQYLDYCLSDTVLLRAGCLKYSKLIYDICEIQPFVQSTTIATLAMAVYTAKFMEPNTIGVISRHNDIQSFKARRWLAFMNSTEFGGRLQTCDTTGEATVFGRKVDGFDPQTGTVLQFHGCFYHACPTCVHEREVKHPLKKQTMDQVYRETERFTQRLAQRYAVRTLWEHEFDLFLAKQPAFLAATAHLQEPIRLEDALFGGRVEAFRTHAVATDTTNIKYRDVVSLYPTVNKKGRYPVGHPVHHPTPQQLDARRLAEYFGIAKVTVLPPTRLHIPLLPMRVAKKLLFGLCRTCMEQQSSECRHSDAERSLTGTWTTLELAKAFELGYQLLRVHSLAYWEEQRTGLFADYVDTFLKLKAESSGTPGMSESEKAAYIAHFFEQEGVQLDKVEENPGLRFVAKIFLNSLWGKFCQREDLTTTEVVNSYAAWLARVTDPNLKVKTVTPIGSEFMMLEYKHRHFEPQPFRYANVPIGVFTTSQARLRLYVALEGLGHRALYCDTDSVVYLHGPGQWEPPGGSALGQWTDEVKPGEKMLEFVSGGPKLYNYCVERTDGSQYAVIKCKGIRLTPEILERSAEMREALLHGGTLQLPQLQFRRHKDTCSIMTLEFTKTYQRVLTKRVYRDGSHPFGYQE